MGQKKVSTTVNAIKDTFLVINRNLANRNRALLYALGGFSILLYLISFVRMGQW